MQVTPSSDSKRIGTDELLKDKWFLTQGLAQAPSSSLLQFHFFPAVGMKLLTKWCFLNLINIILKVIKYCPLHWLQLEVARIQVVFWCLSESKISYTGFMIINQLRESWLPLLLCKLVCNEWAVNDVKEKINQSVCGERWLRFYTAELDCMQ